MTVLESVTLKTTTHITNKALLFKVRKMAYDALLENFSLSFPFKNTRELCLSTHLLSTLTKSFYKLPHQIIYIYLHTRGGTCCRATSAPPPSHRDKLKSTTK